MEKGLPINFAGRQISTYLIPYENDLYASVCNCNLFKLLYVLKIMLFYCT